MILINSQGLRGIRYGKSIIIMKTIINKYKSFMRIGTHLFCVVENVGATETLICDTHYKAF